jgi:hypothetical protein
MGSYVELDAITNVLLFSSPCYLPVLSGKTGFPHQLLAAPMILVWLLPPYFPQCIALAPIWHGRLHLEKQSSRRTVQVVGSSNQGYSCGCRE